MTQALGYAKYALIDTPNDFTRWFLLPKGGVKNCTLKSVLDRVKSATSVVFLMDTFLSPISPALREISSALKTFGNVTKVVLVVPGVAHAVNEVRDEPDITDLAEEPFTNRRLAITKRVIAVADALLGGVETVCTFLAPFQVPVLGTVLNVVTVVNSGTSLVTSGIGMAEELKSCYNLRVNGIVPVSSAEMDEATRARNAHIRALTVLEKVYSTAGKVFGVAAAALGVIGTVALFVATAPAIPFYVVPVCFSAMSILGLFSKYVKESKESLLTPPASGNPNGTTRKVAASPASVASTEGAGTGLVVEEVEGFPVGAEFSVELTRRTPPGADSLPPSGVLHANSEAADGGLPSSSSAAAAVEGVAGPLPIQVD